MSGDKGIGYSILNYIKKSWNQVIYGNYTDDVTLLGTTTMIGLGLADYDLPMDIRDLYYDITHPEGTWECVGRGVIDTAALFPVVGMLKYTDEISTLVKNGDSIIYAGKQVVKHSDEIAEGAKNSSKLSGNIAKNLDTRNIPNMTKQEIINVIPDKWKYTEHNGFVHIKDETGKMRIRIDPSDKVTKYPHVHVYDTNGNLLDTSGNIVDRKSTNGHIPYKN